MRPFVMRRARQSRRGFLKGFLRLAHAGDLLSRLGTLMMRTSPKATIWTAGIMSSGYLSNRVGLPGFTALEALVAPILVGGGMLGGGLAIRFVPAVLSAKWLTVAEASDLNLMEDYRKSLAPAHLNVLWDKVFFYESAIRHRPQERRAERDELRQLRDYIHRQISTWDPSALEQMEMGSDTDMKAMAAAILSERAMGHVQEKSREGFIISSLYALRHPLPQCSEAHAIGFRLNLYEDLCDGAYFDRNDTKLAQQYAGSPVLMDVKNAVGFGRMDHLRQLPTALASKWWCFLVTRRMATGIGRAVQHLNHKYDTDMFNSQVILWPGQEAAPWLERFPGAAKEVLTLRRSVVHSALGRDYDAACITLDRMFLACFEFATDLRARYDPQYCDGSLNYIAEDTGEKVVNSLIDDLRQHGYSRKSIDSAAEYAAVTRREQSDLLEHLAKIGRASLLNDPVSLRAVKIALHTNANGVKDLFLAREPDRALLEREIEAALAEREAYDRRLVGLRLHHQLTILLLDSYKSLVRTLAY